MANDAGLNETYVHGHAPAVVRQHGLRTADEAGAFLLPELEPDMRLLDVGCGPGSITLGFAERLPQGEAVGVDLSAETLAQAASDAEARGLKNLHYKVADVYDLPFDTGYFDVAYAHQVIQHLVNRPAALREMIRVVKPDGRLAVREVDWGTVGYWPLDPWLDRFIEVHQASWLRLGGQPRMGRELRALFNLTGLVDCHFTASVWCYSTLDECIAWGDAYAERLLTSSMGERPVEAGLATRADIEAMAEAFRA
jgi:SAM-dependent methyltransferase